MATRKKQGWNVLPKKGKQTQNCLVAMAYVGGVIGAGFASGQELWQFFGVFQQWGLLGMLFAGVLFAFLGAIILDYANTCGWRQHRQMLAGIFPAPFAWLMDFMLSAFLLAMFSTMLSAMGALVSEHVMIPKGWGIFGFWLFLLFFLGKQGNGVLKLQSILVPPLIFLVLFVAVSAIVHSSNDSLGMTPAQASVLPEGNLLTALKFAGLYVGYNMLGGLTTLVAFSNRATKRAGFVGGTLLGLAGLLVLLALQFHQPVAEQFQIPMLFLAGRISKWVYYLYGFAMAAAILTTAVASGYSLGCRFDRFGWRKSIFFIMLLALPLAWQDFSFLVNRVYGFFGYLGLLLLICIVVQYFRKARPYCGR